MAESAASGKPSSRIATSASATVTYEDSYFIEVDQGTEGSRALERQLQLYVAYYDSGQEQTKRGVFPRVLWLAPDDRRVGIIEGSVARQPARARELFQVARFDDVIAIMRDAHT